MVEFSWYKADTSKSLHSIKEVRVHQRIQYFTQATTLLQQVIELFAQRKLYDLPIKQPTERFHGNHVHTSFLHHILCNQDSWSVYVRLDHRQSLAQPSVSVQFRYDLKNAAFHLICHVGADQEQHKEARFLFAEDYTKPHLLNARELLHMNFSSLNAGDLEKGFPVSQFLSFVEDLAICSVMRHSHATSNRRCNVSRSERKKRLVPDDRDLCNLFDGGE